MSGATGRQVSVQSRTKEKHVQRKRECKIRIVNLQTNDSTRPSGIRSRPATRYRLFKLPAVASCMRFDTGTFRSRTIQRHRNQGLAFVSLPFSFVDILGRSQVETGFFMTLGLLWWPSCADRQASIR